MALGVTRSLGMGAASAVAPRHSLEPNVTLMRLMDMEPEEIELPDWVEAMFAEERAYWTVLRDSGLMDAAAELEYLGREVEGR